MAGTTLDFYKAVAGMSISMILILIFSVYCLAFLWAIYTQNVYFFAFAALQMTFQQFFAKSSPGFIRFVGYFKIQNYFKETTFVYEEPIGKDKSMLCAHPHGIYSVGLLMNLHSYIVNISALSSRFILNTPILGFFIKCWGLQSVDSSNFQALCSKGQNFAIVPGGFEEATLTTRKEDRVFLKCRKGFIKYGLQYGYKLYPMYTFNENKLFYTLGDTLLSFRLFLNKFKLVSSIFISKHFFCYPNPNISIHSVVGPGIQFPKIDNPSTEEVDKYHQIYTDELVSLFERNKDKYGIKGKLAIY